MTAIEYLKANIEETNIPENYWENEIAEMMQWYAGHYHQQQLRVKLSPIPSVDSPKNWTEDYVHENGNYVNKCTECEEFFYGHKRRFICKECFWLPL